MSFADYLANEAYGSSDLKAFRVGPPAMVPWRRANREDGTPATRVGSAAHCRILTPELFSQVYAIKPEGMSFASKEGKAWRDEQGGREILTWDESVQVREVHKAFCGKLAVFDALHDAVAREASVFWTCEQTGVPCKGRPDWFTKDAVYDLKVSIDAEKSLESLTFKAHANGWLNQLAHNRAGLNAVGHNVRLGRLVVISPNPPQQYRVWLLEVREADLDFLEMDNENTRKGIAACISAGHWPGTPDTWQQIELPASAAFTENDLESALEAPVR